MQYGTKKSFRAAQSPVRSRPTLRSPMTQWNRANDFANAKRNHERYMALARAATLAGDRVEAENFYQHAEHYLRLMKEQTT
jgi:hypothetical protein